MSCVDRAMRRSNQVTVRDELAVGIYVASFNTRRFTERCVRSVLDHTASAHVLTVGDSASNDGSREMLRGYAYQGHLHLQVEETPRDHAWWLDRWLHECRHEYALFLDSDVEIRRDGWLSRMLERAEDASIVYAEFVREGRGVVEPVKGRTVLTAERPAVHLLLIRPTDLRGFSFRPFHIEAAWVDEGAIVYDVGAALWHGAVSLELKWRQMPRRFRFCYRHYGGASWLNRRRGLRDHLSQIR